VQYFAVLVGDGKNGKSAMLTAIRALLGSENVSGVDLSMLASGSHRFMSHQLLGKLANVCGDQAYFDSEDTSTLKKLTGGDVVMVEAKGRQPFEAVNSAKIIVACNEAPRLRDKTDGVWRRAVMIPFNWRVPSGEADPRILSPDYWRDELPGMLNWALQGLKRLRERGEFDLPTPCLELLREHRLDSNPARRFLEEHYRQTGSEEDYVIASDVYESYKQWCDRNGIRRDHLLTAPMFGREIRRVFPSVDNPLKRVNGVVLRVWKGLVILTGEPVTP
jgi:putative DNA primase/helicase